MYKAVLCIMLVSINFCVTSFPMVDDMILTWNGKTTDDGQDILDRWISFKNIVISQRSDFNIIEQSFHETTQELVKGLRNNQFLLDSTRKEILLLLNGTVDSRIVAWMISQEEIIDLCFPSFRTWYEGSVNIPWFSHRLYWLDFMRWVWDMLHGKSDIVVCKYRQENHNVNAVMLGLYDQWSEVQRDFE